MHDRYLNIYTLVENTLDTIFTSNEIRGPQGQPYLAVQDRLSERHYMVTHLVDSVLYMNNIRQCSISALMHIDHAKKISSHIHIK